MCIPQGKIQTTTIFTESVVISMQLIVEIYLQNVERSETSRAGDDYSSRSINDVRFVSRINK